MLAIRPAASEVVFPVDRVINRAREGEVIGQKRFEKDPILVFVGLEVAADDRAAAGAPAFPGIGRQGRGLASGR
jgi:hypothetical protein